MGPISGYGPFLEPTEIYSESSDKMLSIDAPVCENRQNLTLAIGLLEIGLLAICSAIISNRKKNASTSGFKFKSIQKYSETHTKMS